MIDELNHMIRLY